MKLTRIEGEPQHLVCAGCNREGIGGTDTYAAASTGEDRTPEEWYQENPAPMNRDTYCAECAVKMSQPDETRSVNQFFSDTAGNEIVPANLPEL